jgi:hypothetical protein
MVTWKEVSTLEGMKLLGLENATRGRVLTSWRNTVGVTRYSFRRRKGDGHILYRWGRLNHGAKATYIDGKLSTVVFYRENPHA